MRYFIESRETYRCEGEQQQWMEIHFVVPHILQRVILPQGAQVMSVSLYNLELLPPQASWVSSSTLSEREFEMKVQAGMSLKVCARGTWSGKLVCEMEEYSPLPLPPPRSYP
jgi:hypothetical protein